MIHNSPMRRGIGHGIQLNPGPLHPHKRPRPDLRRVLPDTPTEHDPVAPAQHRTVRADVLAQPITIELDRELGLR